MPLFSSLTSHGFHPLEVLEHAQCHKIIKMQRSCVISLKNVLLLNNVVTSVNRTFIVNLFSVWFCWYVQNHKGNVSFIYNLNKCTCSHTSYRKFFSGMWLKKVCSFTSVVTLDAVSTPVISICKGIQRGLTRCSGNPSYITSHPTHCFCACVQHKTQIYFLFFLTHCQYFLWLWLGL